MSSSHRVREATHDETAREMDRRGEVIERLEADNATQAAEITRLRAEAERAWHPVTELPDEGCKVVAIYNDGSGAPLLWKHDYGFLDQDGEEVSHDWFYGNVSVWACLPDSVEFWCENLAEDPITLTLPGRAAIEQEGT
jgi:hypothetical protein